MYTIGSNNQVGFIPLVSVSLDVIEVDDNRCSRVLQRCYTLPSEIDGSTVSLSFGWRVRTRGRGRAIKVGAQNVVQKSPAGELNGALTDEDIRTCVICPAPGVRRKRGRHSRQVVLAKELLSISTEAYASMVTVSLLVFLLEYDDIVATALVLQAMYQPG